MDAAATGSEKDDDRLRQRLLELADQLESGEAVEVVCIVSRKDGVIERIYFSQCQAGDS